MKMCNRNFISVLLITISVFLVPSIVSADLLSYDDEHGPKEKRKYRPAKFNMSEKKSTSLLKFQSKLSKKSLGKKGEEMRVDLSLGYGRLFFPANDGYLGFGYVTAKLDSSNRLRFYGSLGYSVPSVNSELLFTYRLLAPQLNRTFSDLGTIDDRIYENSCSVNFIRYSDTFLRESSLNYRFSEVRGQTYSFERSAGVVGFGSMSSHKLAAKMAFGLEDLNLGLIKGFKTSQSLGYEHVTHGEFYNHEEQVRRSLTSLTTLQQKTSLGLFSASYRHVESSQTMSFGYAVNGIQFYAKETRYHDRDSRQMIGFSINFDLWNSRDPYYKKKKLFGKTAFSNRKHEQIRHNSSFSSDSLTTRPKYRKVSLSDS